MKSDDQVNRTSALARMWATSERVASHDRAMTTLANRLRNPGALESAEAFLERVVRPEDSRAAARALSELADEATFFDPVSHAAVRAASGMAPVLPGAAVALARSRVRSMFGHIILDVEDSDLTSSIANTLADGYRVNLNLIGEAPAGERAARERVRLLTDLLNRPDVDYVSVDPTTVVSHINPWDTPGEAERIAERLRGVLRAAAASVPQKFVHFNVGRFRNLALTVEVFERLLSEDEFVHLAAGITLQAYLPDSSEALERLIGFATQRVHAGGAPLKVRIVRGARAAEDRAEAEIRGWVPAQYDSPVDADAQFLDLVDRALRPDVAYALRVGVASTNLFHLAFAHLGAQERGVEAALDIEMLHGGSLRADAEAIAQTVANPVVILTPVAPANRLDITIPYLIRHLPGIAWFGEDDDVRLARQEEAFLAAVAHDPSRQPRRSHTRAPIGNDFASTPDSDPALARTRTMMVNAITAELPPAPNVAEFDADALVAAGRAAAPAWAHQPAEHRARVLRTVAQELEDRREAFITALAHETGAVLAEADAQVSIAIDFARYYATLAQQVDDEAQRDGLRFTPDSLVLVTPSWSAPVADAMNGVLGALGAGCATILKPAPQTPRSAKIAMDAVHAGLTHHGEPLDVAGLALHGESDIGRDLVAHTGVDTVVLTGTYETARLFTSWRALHERGPRVFGETAGKNTVIVTPSADLTRAGRDVVHSAFAHAGQRRSAASLLILVGSVAQSTYLRESIVDAVESLRIEQATHPAAVIGPLVEPAAGENLRTLTELDEGESWIVQPHVLDDAGRLWRPGVKIGVEPGSEFHRTVRPVPVLGIMIANDLDQAIEWHNATDFGLTAGIHSLDGAEVAAWLNKIEAANVYVNKPITDARPGRQPFGGWKNSSVGAGAKAGGPNFLAQLGQWSQGAEPTARDEVGPRVEQLLAHTQGWLDDSDRDWLLTAAHSDAYAREVYRTPVDVAGLINETNVCRYRPGPRLTIRAGSNARLVEVLRMAAGAWAVGVDAGVSLAPQVFEQLPTDVQLTWQDLTAVGPEATDAVAAPARDGIPTGIDLSTSAIGVVAGWRVESTHEFTTRASTWTQAGRIRILDAAETPIIAQAVSTAIAVLPGDVLQDGRRELLTFLREQAISRNERTSQTRA